MGVILALIFFIRIVVCANVTLSLNNDAILGHSFTMKCKTDTAYGTVYMYDPDGLAGSCDLSNNINPCGSGRGYEIKQDVTKLEITFIIPKANRSTHEGVWRCTHASEESLHVVTVLSVPTQITLQGLVSDIKYNNGSFELIVICSCDCAYPGVSFRIDFMNSDKNQTLLSINNKGEKDNSVNCTNAKEMAYRYIMVIKKLEKTVSETRNPVYLKCTVSVKNMLFQKPLYTISKGAITFPVTFTQQSSGVGAGKTLWLLILMFCTVYFGM